jgi:hypothetical protein
MMYPYYHPEILRNHIAELHDRAQHDALAIALRRAHRASSDRSEHARPARLAHVARRALYLVLPRSA